MKKIKLFGILALTLTLLFSCSKDDGDSDDSSGTVDTSKLKGTWRLYKINDHYADEGDDIYNVPSGCNESILTFTDTQVTASNDEDCDGTVDYTNTGNYTVNNTILTKDGWDSEIRRLDGTTLIIREEHIIYDDGSEDFFDVYYERL